MGFYLQSDLEGQDTKQLISLFLFGEHKLHKNTMLLKLIISCRFEPQFITDYYELIVFQKATF